MLVSSAAVLLVCSATTSTSPPTTAPAPHHHPAPAPAPPSSTSTGTTIVITATTTSTGTMTASRPFLVALTLLTSPSAALLRPSSPSLASPAFPRLLRRPPRTTHAVASSAATLGAAPETGASSSLSSSMRDAWRPCLRNGAIAIDPEVDELVDLLEEIRSQPFFRLYSVDLLASCAYMPQEITECETQSCDLYPVDEDGGLVVWAGGWGGGGGGAANLLGGWRVRVTFLSLFPPRSPPTEVPKHVLERDNAEYDFELDGWVRWDMPTDDYYDAVSNPEAYTAYDGSEIWQFIHEKVCGGGCALQDKTKTPLTLTLL